MKSKLKELEDSPSLQGHPLFKNGAHSHENQNDHDTNYHLVSIGQVDRVTQHEKENYSSLGDRERSFSQGRVYHQSARACNYYEGRPHNYSYF